MKKHDKITNRETGGDWMKEIVDASPLKGDKKISKLKNNIEVICIIHWSLKRTHNGNKADCYESRASRNQRRTNGPTVQVTYRVACTRQNLVD